jgi:hypothetical protein
VSAFFFRFAAYKIWFFLIHATQHAHIILLNLVALFVKCTNYQVPHLYFLHSPTTFSYILVSALLSVCRLLSKTYRHSEVLGEKRVTAEFLHSEKLKLSCVLLLMH